MFAAPLFANRILALLAIGVIAEAASLQSPRWKVQVLIYPDIDFQFVDNSGVTHRITASMTQAEKDLSVQAARTFFYVDVPILDSGNMRPLATVQIVTHPLKQLGVVNGSCEYPFWPDPASTAPDRDTVNFDSTFVVFQESAFDHTTGRNMYIGCWGGLTWPTDTNTTYASSIFRIFSSTERGVFKHEWGHSITFYYDAAGKAPKPAIDNHNSTYVHCGTGVPYIYVEDSDTAPIPNSIYNDWSGYTHDYYSGTIATPDQPSRCLGITPAAWASGGPVTHPIAHPGDLNADGSVNVLDLQLLMKRLNQPAAGPSDPMDLDYDGKITVLDSRILVTFCTKQYCAQ